MEAKFNLANNLIHKNLNDLVTLTPKEDIHVSIMYEEIYLGFVVSALPSSKVFFFSYVIIWVLISTQQKQEAVS